MPGVTPDKWARVWRERHPRIPLELLPVDEVDQRRVLVDGEADLCLARLPVDRDGLHQVVLYDEVPMVVAATEHMVAAADEVTTDDLDDEQLVLPHPSRWAPSADQLDWPPMSAKEAVEVAASGGGVVVLPQSVARLLHRKDVLHRPVTDLPPTQVALIWPVEADSDLHQDFVGVVRGRRAGSSRG